MRGDGGGGKEGERRVILHVRGNGGGEKEGKGRMILLLRGAKAHHGVNGARGLGTSGQ